MKLIYLCSAAFHAITVAVVCIDPTRRVYREGWVELHFQPTVV